MIKLSDNQRIINNMCVDRATYLYAQFKSIGIDLCTFFITYRHYHLKHFLNITLLYKYLKKKHELM